MTTPFKTAPPDVSLPRLRRARGLRRAFFVVICLLLGAAALGYAGPHTRTARASANGWDLTIRYDTVTRPGLAATFERTIAHAGGFGGRPVVVALPSKYLSIFDVNGIDPDPVATVTDAESVTSTYASPPSGDTMVVSVDARVQPGVQLRRAKGAISLLDGGPAGRALVSAAVSTFVLP